MPTEKENEMLQRLDTWNGVQWISIHWERKLKCWIGSLAEIPLEAFRSYEEALAWYLGNDGKEID